MRKFSLFLLAFRDYANSWSSRWVFLMLSSLIQSNDLSMNSRLYRLPAHRPMWMKFLFWCRQFRFDSKWLVQLAFWFSARWASEKKLIIFDKISYSITFHSKNSRLLSHGMLVYLILPWITHRERLSTWVWVGNFAPRSSLSLGASTCCSCCVESSPCDYTPRCFIEQLNRCWKLNI